MQGHASAVIEVHVYSFLKDKMSMKFILISSFYVYKTWNVFFKPMEQFSLVFRPSFYLPIILSKGHLWYSDKNPHVL